MGERVAPNQALSQTAAAMSVLESSLALSTPAPLLSAVVRPFLLDQLKRMGRALVMVLHAARAIP